MSFAALGLPRIRVVMMPGTAAFIHICRFEYKVSGASMFVTIKGATTLMPSRQRVTTFTTAKGKPVSYDSSQTPALDKGIGPSVHVFASTSCCSQHRTWRYNGATRKYCRRLHGSAAHCRTRNNPIFAAFLLGKRHFVHRTNKAATGCVRVPLFMITGALRLSHLP